MTEKYVFPAGKYWIGDPCYVMDNQWEELGAATAWFGSDTYNPNCVNFDGIFVGANGNKCFADGTAFGDGEYGDNYGHRYGVDAGLIGLVPVSEVEDMNSANRLGHFYVFEQPFTVSARNGIFNLGHVIIDTLGEDDDDDDFEEDEE
jgi:hypothetical protein